MKEAKAKVRVWQFFPFSPVWTGKSLQVKKISYDKRQNFTIPVWTARVDYIPGRLEESSNEGLKTHRKYWIIIMHFSIVYSHNFEKVKIFIYYSYRNESFLTNGGISCQRNTFPVKIVHFIWYLVVENQAIPGEYLSKTPIFQPCWTHHDPELLNIR